MLTSTPKKGTFLIALLFITASLYSRQSWWSAKLHRADGNNIAFNFEWKTEQGKQVWYIYNAAEKIRVDNIIQQGDSLFVQMPVFESQFRLSVSNNKLSGVWLKGGAVKTQVIPFTAEPGNNRFTITTAAEKNISGIWAVAFAKSKTDEGSVGEFKQAGNKLSGTFLNPTGDYRYLEGIVTKDSLFLSGFEYRNPFAHCPFLFQNHHFPCPVI